jgi:hypothetical protein
MIRVSLRAMQVCVCVCVCVCERERERERERSLRAMQFYCVYVYAQTHMCVYVCMYAYKHTCLHICRGRVLPEVICASVTSHDAGIVRI